MKVKNEIEKWREEWTPSLWLFLLMLNFSFALALWGAFDTRVAVIDFLATLVFTGWASLHATLKIVIEGDWLMVGNAKIEKKYIEGSEESV